MQTLLGKPEGERIVEILGVFGVNGKSKHFTHIPPALVVRFLYARLFYFSRFVFHLAREFRVEALLHGYGMHFSVVVARHTQNFNYLAFRRFTRVGPGNYLSQNLLSRLGARERRGRNQDIYIHFRVVGLEKK